MKSLAILILNRTNIEQKSVSYRDGKIQLLMRFGLNIEYTDILILDYINEELHYFLNLTKILTFQKKHISDSKIKFQTVYFYIDNAVNDDLTATYSSIYFYKILSINCCENLFIQYNNQLKFDLPIFKFKYSYNENNIKIEYNDIDIGFLDNRVILIDSFSLDELLSSLIHYFKSDDFLEFLLAHKYVRIYSNKYFDNNIKLYDSDKIDNTIIFKINNFKSIKKILSTLYPLTINNQ